MTHQRAHQLCFVQFKFLFSYEVLKYCHDNLVDQNQWFMRVTLVILLTNDIKCRH